MRNTASVGESSQPHSDPQNSAPQDTPPVVKKKRTRLSKRRQKLVKYAVQHPDANGRELAAASGFSSQGSAMRALKSKSVQQRMSELMESDPALCDMALKMKLREGLNSTMKVRSFDKSGNKAEEFTDPDFNSRFAYLRLAGKWKGLEVNQTELSGPGGGAIPVESLALLAGLTMADLLKLLEVTK